MLSVFFLRYVFIPMWHSSAQTKCERVFLNTKKNNKGKKKETSKPSYPPPESFLTAVRRTHPHCCAALLSLSYLKYSVAGMENPHRGMCHSKGPSAENAVTWEFLAISDNRTEQKGETQPELNQARNVKHCQLHAAGLCMPGKTVRQVCLLGPQKMASTSKLNTYTCCL